MPDPCSPWGVAPTSAVTPGMRTLRKSDSLANGKLYPVLGTVPETVSSKTLRWLLLVRFLHHERLFCR